MNWLLFSRTRREINLNSNALRSPNSGGTSALLCFLCKISSGVSEALLESSLSCSCLCTVCSSVSEAFLDSLRSLSCSCLHTVCWSVSEAFLWFFMQPIPFLPIHCLFKRFWGSLGFWILYAAYPVLAYALSVPGSLWLPRFISAIYPVLICLMFARMFHALFAYSILLYVLAVHCAFLFDEKACPHPCDMISVILNLCKRCLLIFINFSWILQWTNRVRRMRSWLTRVCQG